MPAGGAEPLRFNSATAERVGLIVMGAATHGLQLQRLVATVPMRVAMQAPCSVMLVKQAVPFERLAYRAIRLGEPLAGVAERSPPRLHCP